MREHPSDYKSCMSKHMLLQLIFHSPTTPFHPTIVHTGTHPVPGNFPWLQDHGHNYMYLHLYTDMITVLINKAIYILQ